MLGHTRAGSRSGLKGSWDGQVEGVQEVSSVGGLSPRLKRTGVHDQGFPVEEVGGRGTQKEDGQARYSCWEVLWLLRLRCSRGPDSKQGGGGEKGQIMKTLEKHTYTQTSAEGGAEME